VSDLDVESLEDLKRMLKEIGYSSKAVEEILKWYKQGNSQND
jgi:SOS response regulatory protein OraA/RecX